MADTTLIYHQFEDMLWVRCNGRGCFVNSPLLKGVCDDYLKLGGNRIVVDLEMCPGVDSTFMGTLAGVAKKCAALGGRVEVASPSARARASMESLGLDMLLEIDLPEAEWRGTEEDRRAVLQADPQAPEVPDGTMDEIGRTRHVLEAHNTLRSMSTRNDVTFGYVCETLEEDLMRHEREHGEA